MSSNPLTFIPRSESKPSVMSTDQGHVQTQSQRAYQPRIAPVAPWRDTKGYKTCPNGRSKELSNNFYLRAK